MIKIGICDDDPFWTEKAESLLREYGEKNNIRMEIRTYPDEEALYQDSSEPLDILFQDIVLHTDKPEKERADGIAVVRRINQIWPDCLAVYATDYLYYAGEVNDTDYAYFIWKNQFEKKIQEVLPKVIHASKVRSEWLTFQTASGTVRLKPRDILYIDQTVQGVKVHLADQIIKVQDSFGEISERVNDLDFRKGKLQTLINLSAIREITASGIRISNGETILLPFYLLGTMKEAFAQWAVSCI